MNIYLFTICTLLNTTQYLIKLTRWHMSLYILYITNKKYLWIIFNKYFWWHISYDIKYNTFFLSMPFRNIFLWNELNLYWKCNQIRYFGKKLYLCLKTNCYLNFLPAHIYNVCHFILTLIILLIKQDNI